MEKKIKVATISIWTSWKFFATFVNGYRNPKILTGSYFAMISRNFGYVNNLHRFHRPIKIRGVGSVLSLNKLIWQLNPATLRLVSIRLKMPAIFQMSIRHFLTYWANGWNIWSTKYFNRNFSMLLVNFAWASTRNLKVYCVISFNLERKLSQCLGFSLNL